MKHQLKVRKLSTGKVFYEKEFEGTVFLDLGVRIAWVGFEDEEHTITVLDDVSVVEVANGNLMVEAIKEERRS